MSKIIVRLSGVLVLACIVPILGASLLRIESDAILYGSQSASRAGRQNFKLLDLRTGMTYTIPTTGLDISEWVWSPDGERFAYIADQTRLIISDGLHEREIALPEAYNLVFNPAWSPDGQQLAIVLNTTRVDSPSRVYTIDVQSGDFKLVSEDSWYVSFPLWLDDTRVLYLVEGQQQGDLLHVVDVTRAQPTARAIDLPPRMFVDNFSLNPARPSELVISGLQYNQTDLYLLDLETESTQRLTATDTREATTTWIDADTVLYSTTTTLAPEFQSVDVRTGQNAVLGSGVVRNWSANGAYIAYSHDNDLYLRSLVTGRIRRLTFTPNVYAFFPVWRPEKEN